jgi:hypothetical protein
MVQGAARKRKIGKEKIGKNGGLLKVNTLDALLKMLMRSQSPGGNPVMSLKNPSWAGILLKFQDF